MREKGTPNSEPVFGVVALAETACPFAVQLGFQARTFCL